MGFDRTKFLGNNADASMESVEDEQDNLNDNQPGK